MTVGFQAKTFVTVVVTVVTVDRQRSQRSQICDRCDRCCDRCDRWRSQRSQICDRWRSQRSQTLMLKFCVENPTFTMHIKVWIINKPKLLLLLMEGHKSASTAPVESITKRLKRLRQVFVSGGHRSSYWGRESPPLLTLRMPLTMPKVEKLETSLTLPHPLFRGNLKNTTFSTLFEHLPPPAPPPNTMLAIAFVSNIDTTNIVSGGRGGGCSNFHRKTLCFEMGAENVLNRSFCALAAAFFQETLVWKCNAFNFWLCIIDLWAAAGYGQRLWAMGCRVRSVTALWPFLTGSWKNQRSQRSQICDRCDRNGQRSQRSQQRSQKNFLGNQRSQRSQFFIIKR